MENSRTEADQNDPFGQYLFGSSRNDRPASREIDNQDEKEFHKALSLHIEDNISRKLVGIIPALIELKHSGKYAKYLNPPNSLVYRAMSNLTPQEAASILGVSLSEIETNSNSAVVIGQITYIPKKSPVSSWSISPEKLFGFTWSKIGMVSVLFVSDTSQSSGDFLFNPDEMKKIVGPRMESFFESEGEGISFGQVKTNKIVFFYRADDSVRQKDIHQKLINALR